MVRGKQESYFRSVVNNRTGMADDPLMYEMYRDADPLIPEHQRLATTRLRLSSHNLASYRERPVESDTKRTTSMLLRLNSVRGACYMFL